jgi:hypothetical protein
MNLKRLLIPAALFAGVTAGLTASPDAHAGGVSVSVAPVKVGVQVGPVTVRGVIGTPAPAPAPARVVVTPARPPGAVWVAAHYTWDPVHRRYIQVAGAWQVPPRPGMVWQAGHWAGHGHGRHWVSGRWV